MFLAHDYTANAFAALDIAHRRGYDVPAAVAEIDGIQAALNAAAAAADPAIGIAFPEKVSEVDKLLNKAATAATVAAERRRIAAEWASQVTDRVPSIVTPLYETWTAALVERFDVEMASLREAAMVLPNFAEQVPENLDEKLFGRWQQTQSAIRALESLTTDRLSMAGAMREQAQREAHHRGMPLNSPTLPVVVALKMPVLPSSNSVRIEDRRDYGASLAEIVEQWRTVVEQLEAAFGIVTPGAQLTMLGHAINAAGKVSPSGKWQMLLAGERAGWYDLRLAAPGELVARSRQRDVFAGVGLAVAEVSTGGVAQLANDIAELELAAA